MLVSRLLSNEDVVITPGEKYLTAGEYLPLYNISLHETLYVKNIN